MLLDQFRKTKNPRYDASRKQTLSVDQIASVPLSPHSSVFKATFAKGKTESSFIVVQGAGANFISAAFQERIKKIVPAISTEWRTSNKIFFNVAGDPCLTSHYLVQQG